MFGRMVIACSTDKQHFKEWAKDASRDFFMAGWREDELVAAAPFMTMEAESHLSEAEIRERAYEVGPVSRWVLGKKVESLKLRVVSK